MNMKTKANFQCDNAVGTPQSITNHILKPQSWLAQTCTKSITLIKRKIIKIGISTMHLIVLYKFFLF